MQQLISLGKVHLVQFVESLVDKDEGDEESKDLLGEGRDVAHQEASLSCHNNEDEDDEPQTNPHSACQILNALCLAELKWKGEGVTHGSLGCLPHLLPIKIKDSPDKNTYICLDIQHRDSELRAGVTHKVADFALTPARSHQAGLYCSSLCNSTSFTLC